MKDGILDTIELLDACDIKPTKENIIKEIKEQIKNLYSHIGEEAHKHSAECGVVDLTGITWEEHDKWVIEIINEYKECIRELENGGIIAYIVDLREDEMCVDTLTTDSVKEVKNFFSQKGYFKNLENNICTVEHLNSWEGFKFYKDRSRTKYIEVRKVEY